MKMDIKTGLSKLNIAYDDDNIEKLEYMLDLLNQWNKKHNLTRYKTKEEQIIYHILDSLAGYPFFASSDQILDLGTGAGFPGIPLAIFYPNKHFHLIDSNGKKIAYLRMLVKALALSNVSLYHSRIEDIQLDQAITVTARALASCDDIIQLTQNLSVSNYILYIGKEILHTGELHQVHVPGSTKTHHILDIQINKS